MSATAEVTFFCKAATVGLLLFGTLQLLRTRQLAAGLTALCTASVACYVLCSMGIVSRWAQNPWLWVPSLVVHAGCFAVPFFFWLMTRALFEDRFRLQVWHGVLLALVLCLGFFLMGRGELYQAMMRQPLVTTLRPLLPQAISVGLIVHALVLAQLGRRDDLVESRRTARLILVLSVGVYALVVALVEISLKGPGSGSAGGRASTQAPALLELLHSFGLLGISGYALFQVNQPLRLFASPASDGRAMLSTPPASEPSATGLALKQRFWTEELFRTEDLTVSRLAALLGQPEYLLRRTINQELGFRNFNDFLNQARVEEAEQILKDPDHGDLPILRLAMDLGYGSLAPFNRAFRRITGMTPSQYRHRSLPAPSKNN